MSQRISDERLAELIDGDAEDWLTTDDVELALRELQELRKQQAASVPDDVHRDAVRYRWLRSQHWSDGALAVVCNPKAAIRLGHDSPSESRLDEMIDQLIGLAPQPKPVASVPFAWAREWGGDVSDLDKYVVVFNEEEKDGEPGWFALYTEHQQVGSVPAINRSACIKCGASNGADATVCERCGGTWLSSVPVTARPEHAPAGVSDDPLQAWADGWNAGASAVNSAKAQQAPIVPGEKPNPDWRTTNPTDYPFEMAYIKGWNECRAAMLAAAPEAPMPACGCHSCTDARREAAVLGNWPRMILCPKCGNKRCPHANDHRNACTGSNEPGQPGSAYPKAEPKS